MRAILRRTMLLGVIGLVAAFMATGSGRADTGDGQVLDWSHQLADMQKKVTELQSRGQRAKRGKLAGAATCGFGDPSQVFLPWADPATYVLAPQGDLSSMSRW